MLPRLPHQLRGLASGQGILRGALAATVLLCGAAAAHAVPRPNCARGPCNQPRPIQALLRPAATDVSLAVNFGLMLPAGAGPAPGWEVVCEENFGRSVPDTMKVSADGRVFVPAPDGLYVSRDGCSWDRAKGAILDRQVYDVAFDPRAPERVLAIGAQSTLFVSMDGGATFAEKRRFAGLSMDRVFIAPSDPKTVYVSGYSERAPLAIAWSTDGGDQWTIDNPAGGIADRNEYSSFVILGVSPENPQTVYLSGMLSVGDDVWVSRDHGRAPQRTLAFEGSELIAGIAFGSPGTVFVAARPPIPLMNQPTATLHVSRDGGMTWSPVPSGAKGPRYFCLGFRDGKLYACGDELAGDPFLLGTSTDDGKTWSPAVRLADLRGVKRCVSGACASTSVWLCESHGICQDVPERPADGGVACPGGSCDDGGGCDCRLGRGTPGGSALLAAFALGALLLRRRGGAA